MNGRVGMGRLRVQENRVHPLCQQLWNLRVAKNITLTKLAEDLGYNPYTIGRWERGEASPTLCAVTDWAETLGAQVTFGLDA